MSRRKQYDSQFKAQVALEAIKNQRTLAQIASEYGVHPNQVSQWKKQVVTPTLYQRTVKSPFRHRRAHQ